MRVVCPLVGNDRILCKNKALHQKKKHKDSRPSHMFESKCLNKKDDNLFVTFLKFQHLASSK